jgi:RND family efflux transporter MFP subunit
MRTWLLPLTLLSATAAACGGGSHTPTQQPAGEAVDARAVQVQVRQVADVFEAGGVVQAQNSATLSSRIMAPVREVKVRPGDRVRRGQALVVLDDRDLAAVARQARTARDGADEGTTAAAADLEGAKASLALAKASHTRIASLHSRNSATAQELDEATAALHGAESRLAAAEARVRQAKAGQASASAASDAAGVTAGFGVVTAPFDGLVTEKFVEPGNMVAPGTPLLRVEQTGGFRLDVRVDESRIAFVELGDAVPVVLDKLDGSATTEVTATVQEVARAVDADTRAVLVKLTLPDVGLTSGTFGRARLPGAVRRALVIPTSAVVRQGQVTSVFTVDGDKARLRLLQLGATSGDVVEVVSGLSEGERVVDAPPAGLSDGRVLRVSGAASPSVGGGR